MKDGDPSPIWYDPKLWVEAIAIPEGLEYYPGICADKETAEWTGDAEKIST